jgi:hypothetical protein
VCCGPTNYFVNELRIDDRQHLLPIGPHSLSEPKTASYYWFFHTRTGFTTVDHYGSKPGTGRRELLFYLETNRSQSLDRTVKRDEILRGIFGSVYFERTCFFNRPVASNPNYVSISVGSDSISLGSDKDEPHENPMELSRGMEEPIPPLTSVGLVRIFHVDPEYVVVSANYESTGELGSLNVGRTSGRADSWQRIYFTSNRFQRPASANIRSACADRRSAIHPLEEIAASVGCV